MVLTEEMKRNFPLLTDNDFDLSKYLDSIPYEELKDQYEDYSSYEIINGFDTLPEDLSNQINEDDDR